MRRRMQSASGRREIYGMARAGGQGASRLVEACAGRVAEAWPRLSRGAESLIPGPEEDKGRGRRGVMPSCAIAPASRGRRGERVERGAGFGVISSVAVEREGGEEPEIVADIHALVGIH